MRRWWPFLFILLLCLPAVSPYLSGDIPRSNDSLSHLYRAFQLARLVRAGIFFPRWAPDLAHGYGYPIFNYFAYLSHYLIVLFHLIGLPLLSALRASYIVALIASGFTAHIFARDLADGDDRAGLVAAVAYVYSPYVLYTAHVRGGLPENLALAFLPLALWAVRRALRIRYEDTKTQRGAQSLEPPRFDDQAEHVIPRGGRAFGPPRGISEVSPRDSSRNYTARNDKVGTRNDMAGTRNDMAGTRNDMAGTSLKLKGLWNFSAQLRDLVSSWFNSPSAIYAFIAALAIAAFITAHAGMALQYLPLIGLFGLYVIFSHTPTAPHRLGFWILRFGILSLIFTLALTLTAFLWLPTLTDLAYVQYQIAFARSGATYTNNFFYLAELFAYPRLPVYTDVLNPPLVRSLPLLASALAVLGLFRLRSLDTARKANYLFLFALFALTSFLILDLSKPVWDNSSLLQRSVLPWRFLGPASLFASVLAGLAIGDWKFEVGSLKLQVGILLFLVTALPFLFPPREPAPEQPALADLARYEAPPFLVGTTTNGEYTPNPVKEFPDTTDQRAALLANREPERLDIAASPPPGVTVEHLAARPAHDTYRLSLNDPLTATYRSFFFPGWQATLDGKPLDLRPTDPNGLIAFDLPAGEHSLEIRFGSTPVRMGASFLSVISLLVISYCVLRVAYQSRNVADNLPHPATEHRQASRAKQVGATPITFVVCRLTFAAALIASLFIVSLFITKPGPPSTQHPLNLDFGGELTLIGYDIQPSAISHQLSAITLVWQAQHPLGVPYGMNVRLTDDAGLIWSDTNIERPRDWRFTPGTDFWPTDEFIYDSYVLKPLPGAPPGAYHLEAIVYRADTLQALSVQRIGEHAIERPTNLPLAEPLANLNGVALIHVSADREVAAPGDPYRLTLRWQAASALLADQDFKLELIDSAGAVVHAIAGPVVPGYPPSKWEAGDVLDQPAFFRLPAHLNSGGYHWRLNGAVELAASLQIIAPDRVFAPPALTNPLNIELGESISLLGYNVAISDNEIKVDLVWQARAEMPESYRVFLHLLDANGELVSQSDGEPASWTRPTTGWVAGEVVTDSRTLTAPGPGEYTLRLGMVNEAGERLAAEGWPEGAIMLGNISVLP